MSFHPGQVPFTASTAPLHYSLITRTNLSASRRTAQRGLMPAIVPTFGQCLGEAPGQAKQHQQQPKADQEREDDEPEGETNRHSIYERRHA